MSPTRRNPHEWVYSLEHRSPDLEHLLMGATSWQHIRTFGGDVERTLEQLRHDVFGACAVYVADEPAITPAPAGSPAVACLDRLLAGSRPGAPPGLSDRKRHRASNSVTQNR